MADGHKSTATKLPQAPGEPDFPHLVREMILSSDGPQGEAQMAEGHVTFDGPCMRISRRASVLMCFRELPERSGAAAPPKGLDTMVGQPEPSWCVQAHAVNAI